MIPLVLIPGFMCDERLFAPQDARFGADRDAMCTMPRGGSIPEIASNLLRTAPGRFALGGLSLGGIVAMEVYRQAPDRVERLALLATNALADAPEYFALRNRQLAVV